ncbi:MAG: hypothetical protein ACRDJ1_02695 [Actinomycetota bacterium]
MQRGSPVQRSLRDAFTRSVVLAVGLIAGGFVAIALGWKGVAASLLVAEQLPYLLSGGVGGLALIVAGAGILTVQVNRYWNARERTRLDLVLAGATAVRRDGAVEPEPLSRA